MTPESQPSDKLKAILERARSQTPAKDAETPPRGEEAQPTDLVDKDAALPDPLALARLYQSSDLQAKLPEETDERPGGKRTPSPGWQELPAPAARRGGAGAAAAEATAAGDPGHEAGSATRPSMTPSEMRAVMAELQQTFQVSDRSYETYELSSRPVDDLPATSDEERDAEMAEALAAVDAAAGSPWLYLAGAGLVLVVVIVFLFLAIDSVGPFKPLPNQSPAPVSPAAVSPAAPSP